MTTEPQFSVEGLGLTINLDPSFLMEIGFFSEGEEAALQSGATVLASLVRLTAAAELARLGCAGRGRPRAGLTDLLRRTRGAASRIGEYLDAQYAAALAPAVGGEAQSEAPGAASPQIDPAFAALVDCALGKPVEEASAPEMLAAISSLGLAADELRGVLSAKGPDFAALAEDRGAAFSLRPR